MEKDSRHDSAGRRLPSLAAVPPTLPVVAAALAVCLATPSAVRAACGDYVTHGVMASALPSHASSLPPARKLHTDQHTSGTPAQPQSPCQGPNCSRRVPL